MSHTQPAQACDSGNHVLGPTGYTGKAEIQRKLDKCRYGPLSYDCLQQDAGARSESGNKRSISPKVPLRNYGNPREPTTNQQQRQLRVVTPEPVTTSPVVKLEYTFGQRLQDAQRVEDLFEASFSFTLRLVVALMNGTNKHIDVQLVRDAERLNATEVAQLPVRLLQLYQQRSTKEQQSVTTHLFFEGIAKPWALEPAKLDPEVGHSPVIVLSDCQTGKCWVCMHRYRHAQFSSSLHRVLSSSLLCTINTYLSCG